jgi:hypothetical protein
MNSKIGLEEKGFEKNGNSSLNLKVGDFLP